MISEIPTIPPSQAQRLALILQAIEDAEREKKGNYIHDSLTLSEQGD